MEGADQVRAMGVEQAQFAFWKFGHGGKREGQRFRGLIFGFKISSSTDFETEDFTYPGKQNAEVLP